MESLKLIDWELPLTQNFKSHILSEMISDYREILFIFISKKVHRTDFLNQGDWKRSQDVIADHRDVFIAVWRQKYSVFLNLIKV